MAFSHSGGPRKAKVFWNRQAPPPAAADVFHTSCFTWEKPSMAILFGAKRAAPGGRCWRVVFSKGTQASSAGRGAHALSPDTRSRPSRPSLVRSCLRSAIHGSAGNSQRRPRQFRHPLPDLVQCACPLPRPRSPSACQNCLSSGKRASCRTGLPAMVSHSKKQSEGDQLDVAATGWACERKLLSHPGQEFRPGNP